MTGTAGRSGPPTTRADAAALDDPLPGTREQFCLPEGVIYLDGNSLGALPRGVAERLHQVITEEWQQGLVGSWNATPGRADGWIGLAARVAARVAPLVGVDGSDVLLGDSTTVSLFKTMVGAARMRPGRHVLVVDSSTFPTDGYVAAGVADLLGLELRWCAPDDPVAAVDEDTALLSLTHVDFRTGAMYDMAAVTAGAHERGALVQWDLCHSVGAVPVDLTGSGADLAVGCTYKYLNGGPGSPAFTWVAPHHQDRLRQPITGWMGHAEPFAMARDYRPRPGIGRLASGTPPVLALSALDAALDAFEGLGMDRVRAASLSLTDLFLRLLDERFGDLLEVVTPRAPQRRGSQVSFRHPHAYGIVQALAERGVVGDFRDPDIARFGFTPLYLRHVDVYDAVEHLAAVLEHEEHLAPAFWTRREVT